MAVSGRGTSAWALVCACAIGAGVTAQVLKEGNNEKAVPRSAADEQRSFIVPAGFSVELVASEDTGLPKPVSIAFDDAGRMWSATATEYPRDRDPLVWSVRGQDRIVVVDRPYEPGPH